MKFYIYSLSLLLAFAPAVSYAFAPPVIAIAGSTAGRVAVQEGSKAVIKKVAPNAMTNLMKNAVATCKANPMAMYGCTKILKEMEDDDVVINHNVTNNNDIEVEIYRITDDTSECIKICPTAIYDSNSCSDDVESYYRKHNANYGLFKSDDYKKFTNFVYKSPDLSKVTKNSSTQSVQISISMEYDYSTFNGSWSKPEKYTHSINPYAVKLECPNLNKRYLTDEEIAKYVRKHATGDDITNIYNYDYSQHQNITVNNKTESGDTINNQKNKFDKSENEKTTSENATQKMRGKHKDYDIDDINDENCDKNEKGEYDKCGKDRDKKDGEDDDEEKKEDEDEEDKDKKKDDEDELIDCKASEFHKKVCDWIDWTQEEHEPKTNTKVDVDEPELPKIDDDKIKFRHQCPEPKQININVVGYDYEAELNYEPLCEFFSELKPFVVGMGWFGGAFIIAGRRY